MTHPPNPQNAKFCQLKTVFKDGLNVSKVNVEIQHEDGSWAAPVASCFVDTGSKVAVLPFDPYQNQVVLVEYFRIGTLNQPEGPWHLELPARPLLDKNQNATVKQALAEEIALDGLNSEFIGDFYTSPNVINEKIYLYCAGVDSSQISSTGKVEVLSVQDAIDATYNNYLRDSVTIVALHWLNSNYKRLQKKWQ